MVKSTPRTRPDAAGGHGVHTKSATSEGLTGGWKGGTMTGVQQRMHQSHQMLTREWF